jgi:hypothetical protein
MLEDAGLNTGEVWGHGLVVAGLARDWLGTGAGAGPAGAGREPPLPAPMVRARRVDA